MAHRSSAVAGRPGTLDIPRRPLSIRSLGTQRVPPLAIAERVKGEFAEMRGFSPTLAQAARLFDLPPDECDRVLGSLVSDGSLVRGPDGRYRRKD